MSSASAASDARASTWSPMPENFWIACSTSFDVATTGRTSRPVIVRMSSSAYTFAGSDIATRSLPSSSPIGRARYRRHSASGSKAVAAASIRYSVRSTNSRPTCSASARTRSRSRM